MKLPEPRISSFVKEPLTAQKYWSETQNRRPLFRKPTQRVFLPLIVRSLPEALERGRRGPGTISGSSLGSTQLLLHKAPSAQTLCTAGGWPRALLLYGWGWRFPTELPWIFNPGFIFFHLTSRVSLFTELHSKNRYGQINHKSNSHTSNNI